jgi:hypothetical protein
MDEPDKHLDPQSSVVFMDTVRQVFVNQGVQVIMTTHKPDLVALAKDSELFTFKRKDGHRPVLQSSNKLLGLARLSRNLGGFFNRNTKVYVESFDDADFYKWMYANVKRHAHWLRYQQLQLPAVGGGAEAAPNEALENLKRLSFRYTMDFSSASLSRGEAGGCAAVYFMVERTSTDVLSNSTALYDQDDTDEAPVYVSNLFEKYRAHGTFGLIDKDYGTGAPGDAHEDLCGEGGRVVKLSRHSLECFMFDPIMLCSLDNILEKIILEPDDLPEGEVSLIGSMQAVSENINQLILGEEQDFCVTSLKRMYREILKSCIAYQEACSDDPDMIATHLDFFKDQLLGKLYSRLKRSHPKGPGETSVEYSNRLNVMVGNCIQVIPDAYISAAVNSVYTSGVVAEEINDNHGDTVIPTDAEAVQTINQFLTQIRLNSIETIGTCIQELIVWRRENLPTGQLATEYGLLAGVAGGEG